METLKALVSEKFIRFCLIGSFGFLVDAGLTLLLIALGWSAFLARIVAIGLTIIVCWRLNRWLTFGSSGQSQMNEGARYFLVATLTGVLNYSLYAVQLSLWPTLWPVIAIVIATLVCTALSYLGYSRFAFKPAT